MKNKILFGIMVLVVGVFMAGCSDDDYAISTQPLLADNSVVTGSADVTATSAILHGTVSGLGGQASSAYTTGFNYGEGADALTEKVVATGGEDFSATVAVTSRSAYSFLSAGARLAVCPAIATPTSDTCFKKASSDMDVLNPSKHSNLSMVPPV